MKNDFTARMDFTCCKRMILALIVVPAMLFSTACTKIQEVNASKTPVEPGVEREDIFITIRLTDGRSEQGRYRMEAEVPPEAGTLQRDVLETVTPYQAMQSAARFLLRTFGDAASNLQLTAQYVDDGQNTPHYLVSARGARPEETCYQVMLNAKSGKAYTAMIMDKKETPATNSPEQANLTFDRNRIGQTCLDFSKQVVGSRFVWTVMVDSVESKTLFVESYAYDPFDLRCKVAVRTASGESYILYVLYDLDAADEPCALQGCEAVSYAEWEEYLAYCAKPNGTWNARQPAFSKETVRRVYAALCGDAQPFTYSETKEELTRYLDNGERMLALASRHPSSVAPGNFQAVLDDASAAIATAPDEWEYMPIDLILACDNGLLRADIGRGVPVNFHQFLYPRQMLIFSGFGLPEVRNTPVETPLAMTQEQAQQRAEALFETLGMGQRFVLADIDREIVNHTVFEYCVDDAYKTCMWRMRYVLKGDPSLTERSADTNVYCVDLPAEGVELSIGDEGILSFTWCLPEA